MSYPRIAIIILGVAMIGTTLRLMLGIGSCEDSFQVVQTVAGASVSCSKQQSLEVDHRSDGTTHVLCRCKIPYR